MITLLDTEKAFDMLNILHDKHIPTRNKRKLLQHNDGNTEKPSTNSILNGESLKAFPLKQKQGC